jgi:hypothetical protein
VDIAAPAIDIGLEILFVNDLLMPFLDYEAGGSAYLCTPPLFAEALTPTYTNK